MAELPLSHRMASPSETCWAVKIAAIDADAEVLRSGDARHSSGSRPREVELTSFPEVVA